MAVLIRYIPLLFITIFNCVFYISATAQQVDVEYLHAEMPSGWVPLNVGERPDSVNVLIRTGDTVTMDTDAYVKNMQIEAGAVVNAAGSTSQGQPFKLRPGAFATTGAATLLNQGVLGAATGNHNGIAIEIPPACRNFTLTGPGTTSIAYIRPQSKSAELSININQDVSLNHNGIAISAIPLDKEGSTEDKIDVNIAAGKTVTLTNPSGQIHGLTQAGGTYTYNINGTVDASATTVVQNIVPAVASPASTTIFNIAGVLKFGDKLNIAPATESGGKLTLNILNGGVADATLTNILIPGANFFITHGTGVLKRKVGSNDVLFPVAAGGTTTPSAVILNNAGVADNFSVLVSKDFTVSVPNSNKMVNRQWTIIPDSNTNSNVTVTPAWLTGDQAGGFSPALPVAVLQYHDGAWLQTSATIKGTGSLADPYTAMAAGFTTFGLFAVHNTELPPPGSALSVYPNPVIESMNLTFPATTVSGTLKITTSDGKRVFTEELEKGATARTYNVSTWLPGVYFLIIEGGGKKSSVKFIKQ
ncbi:hypothetical protein DJ568_14500 [Mucilaginibacter hurinus]|uniref:Secretion system C-terminal sorting domain-containing protein n=1 Tax=Mucilaginibacter hurinus TaxID=2201324 RepID=A0A367GL86_9SPHI|nr:T9SS type A sorting domain-containing protein [Mucilaginibacter hurinus]RCH54090.1 hypothetical protein DJ568_14500 [Mucilaginibacter hurinus]